MNLVREYNLSGRKKYWVIKPESVKECAICHLLANEYPHLFDFISEFTSGGLREDIYLKIKNIDDIRLELNC